MPEDIQNAIKAVKHEIMNGTIRQEDIEERCKKILAAKYWTGLGRLQVR